MAKKTTPDIKQRVLDGIIRRTHEFNEATFPHPDPSYTPEQLAVYNYLNGESSSFLKIFESDRPTVKRDLLKIAGLTDMPSRFDLNNYIIAPPYTAISFRENIDSYPALFPYIQGRIAGLWSENGTGSARDYTAKGKQLRPVTDDELKRFNKFPPEKLFNLWGAIDFADETALRAAITAQVIEQTEKFKVQTQCTYPEGLTDKGRKILEVFANGEITSTTLSLFSIAIDDPTIMPDPETGRVKDLVLPKAKVKFEPFCAMFHTYDSAGSSYHINQVHIQAGIQPSDILFSNPDEGSPTIGNHADEMASHLRAATPEEITAHIAGIETGKLHLYVMSLTEERLTSLL